MTQEKRMEFIEFCGLDLKPINFENSSLPLQFFDDEDSIKCLFEKYKIDFPQHFIEWSRTQKN